MRLSKHKFSVGFGTLVLLVTACGPVQRSRVNDTGVSESAESTVIESAIPSDRLAKIKAALPAVAFKKLQNILNDKRTYWYDHESTPPAYQDSVGVNVNTDWDRMVAVPSAVKRVYNSQGRHWHFPFRTTAGADDATNIRVANFLYLPEVNGKTLPIPMWQVAKNDNRPSWQWMFPNGTVVGEVIFIEDGQNLLPSEIRIRTRYAKGWSANAYRPFPSAASLALAIKERRPDWSSQENLRTLIAHLENTGTLQAKRLTGVSAYAKSFDQQGSLDVLPDFGDANLVRELLTKTTFVSSFQQVWKTDGVAKAFAASTRSNLSVVPNNYNAGLIEVSDESCMRCHKETGRMMSEYDGGLYLYGEMWGKDNIFSFHVFQEPFGAIRRTGSGPGGMIDNRRANSKFLKMGIIENFNESKHSGPYYRPR